MEADVIIIAACIPSLRPFAISVSHSIKDGSSRSRPKRSGYQVHSSGTPLALKPMHLGPAGSGSNPTADDARSEASLVPSHRVKQTTDISLEWE